MTDREMATHKRINITIHPIELEKLDQIAKKNNETRSGMIARLIQEYDKKKNDRVFRVDPKDKEELKRLIKETVKDKVK